MAGTPSSIPLEPPPLYRVVVAGVLAGLASLVPGVSAGTMVLAAGIYPAVIAAIAEVSTGRIRRQALWLLGVVFGSAALAVILVAGVARDAVVAYPSVFLALFLGLTLGGTPMLWRLTEHRRGRFWVAAALGIGLVLVPVLIAGPAGTGVGRVGAGGLVFFAAGALSSFTMALPGVSGATTLVMIGMYVPYLDAVDRLKTALNLGAASGAALADAAGAVLPFLVGSVLGVIIASLLMRYLLQHFPEMTTGALLGLLLGATAALWPFQTAAGEVFTPTAAQAGVCLLAFLGGAMLTIVLGRRRSPPLDDVGSKPLSS